MGVREPPSRTNTSAAIHVARAGTAVLKHIRSTVRRLFFIFDESTRPSSAAVIAPADGPTSKAATMLNVSEMEKLTCMAGMRSVAHPLAAVSTSRMIHSAGIGRDNTSETEYARRIAPARLALQTNTALCEICTNPVIGRLALSNHGAPKSTPLLLTI